MSTAAPITSTSRRRRCKPVAKALGYGFIWLKLGGLPATWHPPPLNVQRFFLLVVNRKWRNQAMETKVRMLLKVQGLHIGGTSGWRKGKEPRNHYEEPKPYTYLGFIGFRERRKGSLKQERGIPGQFSPSSLTLRKPTV